MWNTIKDYLTALLGALFLLISIILIPEIRAKRKYVLISVIGMAILVYLGIDKINRDNEKDTLNQSRRVYDSSQIAKLSSDIKAIKINDSSILNRVDSSLIPYNLRLKDNRVVPVSIKFVDNRSTNVNSYNQRNGQTAEKIINH